MSGGPENPYRPTGAALSEPSETRGTGEHVLAWLGVVLGLFPLGVALLMAPRFAQLFRSFNMDLPLLTELVFDWPFVLALPSALMALWRLFRPGGRRQAWTLFGVGLALAILLSLLTFLLFYLPILQLASVV